MHVKNSFCIPVFNRYTIPIEGGVLHPMDTLIEGILSQKPEESFEIVIVDFGSTDTDYAWLRRICKRSILFTVHEQFSLGRGRNLACHIATGERLFVLDCDMAIPGNFATTLSDPIDKGKVCFPKYFLTHPNGRLAREGSGWGNVAMLKSVWEKLRDAGVVWPEGLTWGGEDTCYANPIVKGHKNPYFRELVSGFTHVWHPKSGTPWYDSIKKEK